MKLKATVIVKLRNVVWRIRRAVTWDDTNKSVFYNGIYSMQEFSDCGNLTYGDTFKEFFRVVRSIPLPLFNKLPETDCVLQYEEKGQLASLHYFLDKKYQLHIRFFSRFDVSEMSRLGKEIDVYSHVEIRPDYDPIAHVKGKELRDGCSEWEAIYSVVRMKAHREKFKY